MIIRASERFAIQYVVEDYSTQWLNGKFSYLVGREAVGDFDKGASLEVAAAGIRRKLQHSGKRFDAILLALPVPEAFHKIYRALFQDDQRDDGEIRSDSEYFSKFDVGSFSDAFDRWYCFLVEGNNTARFLYANIETMEHPCEIVLREGEFDEVCREFLIDLENSRDRK